MKRILKNTGYSSIELLVVIIIISIITAVALKSLRTVNDTSRVEKTKKELEQLAYGISGDPEVTSGGTRISFGYVGDVGGMPPNLDALISNPGSYATWKGPYLRDDYLPSSGSSNTEFKIDEWGTVYNYSGNTITSTGGGGTITRKIANSVNDLIYNIVAVTVTDQAQVPPGNTGKDSVQIVLTHPNGTGGMSTRTKYPAKDGFVTLDSVPIGQHTLRVIYTPQNDTLTREVTVNPGEVSNVNVSLFRTIWGTSSGGSSSSIVSIRPNGVGSNSQLTGSGCANNWQCVDEIASDDDVSYVIAPGSTTFDDSYTAEDPTVTGTIDSIRIFISVKNTATNNQIVNTLIRTGGTLYAGVDIDLNAAANYTNFSTTYLLNPNTSAAWTWPQINDIEIGIRMKKPAHCTQVWAEIYYR